MDSNDALWLSQQRVITDEVAQSSSAWCANNRGGNRPSKFESVNSQQFKAGICPYFFCLYNLRACTQRLNTNKKHVTQ